MTDNENNSLRTDIALIKRDINQIEKSYKKMEDSFEKLSSVSEALAVQEKILETNEKRIGIIEQRVLTHHDEEVLFRKELNKNLEEMKTKSSEERERKHKELLDSIKEVKISINKKLDDQDERITKLENWKIYVLGITATLLFLWPMIKTFVMSLFGG